MLAFITVMETGNMTKMVTAWELLFQRLQSGCVQHRKQISKTKIAQKMIIANTPPKRDLHMFVPRKLQVKVASYFPHHAKLQSSLAVDSF